MRLSTPGLYVRLLSAGDKNNHIGAYLSSEWWKRNLFIYEHILKRLDWKEKKILVIFGSSHTAMIEQLMKVDQLFNIVDVNSILK